MPRTKKNGQNRKRKNNETSSEANALNDKAVKEWLEVCETVKKRLEREA